MKTRRLFEFHETYRGCWICISHRANSGYGYTVIRRNGTTVLLHRYMYEKYRGAIPGGMCVLHHCDNPACNNPDHLFLGTMADNTRDMINKGRGKQPGLKGIDNGRAVLTETRVREIRTATDTHRAIAKIYGISHANVGRIKRGEIWKHLKGESCHCIHTTVSHVAKCTRLTRA